MALKRTFAPLGDAVGGVVGGEGGEKGAPRLRGVVFDVDGTLCEPQNYMFGEMRAALGIPKSIDILDHIHSLPTPQLQDDAMDKIKNIERTAMKSQKPQPGLQELMGYLDSRGVRKGLCTRNFDAPVHHLLTKFLPESNFAPIVTRAFRPPKPHPAGILHIAGEWARLDGWDLPDSSADAPSEQIQIVSGATDAVTAKEEVDDGKMATSAALRADAVSAQKGVEIDVIMVGDSIDDMTAGYRAGAATVLLVNKENAHLEGHEHTDLVVGRLDELIEILERGFEVRR